MKEKLKVILNKYKSKLFWIILVSIGLTSFGMSTFNSFEYTKFEIALGFTMAFSFYFCLFSLSYLLLTTILTAFKGESI